MADTIVTFTRRPIEEILETGGSQAWRLSPVTAREKTYLVCARNSKSPLGAGPEAHRSGFLIGKISGVVPSREKAKRFVIEIEEWAEIHKPGLWEFGRNPVHYADLSDLGIDPEAIEFQPVPKRRPRPKHQTPDALSNGTPRGLTISQAKEGLAQTFGVPVDAIEITVRG